jgi:hypothetical protein
MRYDDKTKNNITALMANVTANDAVSASIDGANYSHVQFFIMTSTGAGQRLSVKVQESADNVSFTDISGAITVINANTSNALRTLLIDHKKYQRYLRILSNHVLGTPTLYAAYCIQQNEKNSLAPAPQVIF